MIIKSVNYKTIITEYVYKQTINIDMSYGELSELNNNIIDAIKRANTKHIKTANDMRTSLYLKQLTEGANLTNMTTFNFVISHLNITNNRIKDDRNTIINIYVTD